MKTLHFIALGALIQIGCTTPNKRETANSLYFLSQQKASFADVVKYMGPPDKCVDYDARKTCDWLRKSGHSAYLPIGFAVHRLEAQESLARLNFTDGVLIDFMLSGRWP